jgi:hypothetical protein
MALKKVDVDPDPTWMRYDKEINAMVCHVVRGLHLPTHETLRELAKEQIPTRDISRVVRILLEVFRTLHENNAVSYGLEAEEYRRYAVRISSDNREQC